MGNCAGTFRNLFTLVAGLIFGAFFSSCAPRMDNGSHMFVSVKEQKMMLVQNGEKVKTYPISTSKYGLGSKRGSRKTPLGRMRVARKIGSGAPSGAVFKSRRRTGEILRPNAPGRDPIVSRILWLDGQESRNRNTFRRYIYIHGTPEERKLGRPVSYGCIRMASRDVIDLYRRVGVGSHVYISRGRLPALEPPEGEAVGPATTQEQLRVAAKSKPKKSTERFVTRRLNRSIRPGA